MQLGLLKALYTDTLTRLYSYSEAENLFYITLQWLEKKSKTAVLLGQETMLEDTYHLVLEELLAGVPIQYITHEAPFYGLDFFVDERVLIPRPETEQLVHWIIQDNEGFTGSVLDIGTGSGCIALTLKNSWPEAKISACDISGEALSVAKKNADELNLNIDLFPLNILKEEIGEYSIIVSNPPYIAAHEKQQMHQNVLDHEPHLALFVEDDDPLLFYKRIIQLASNQRTKVYFETSEYYRDALDNWLNENEYTFEWQLDFQEKNRMLKVTF